MSLVTYTTEQGKWFHQNANKEGNLIKIIKGVSELKGLEHSFL